MREILFASTNAGKLAEVQEAARNYPLPVLGPSDLIASGRVFSVAVPVVEENAGSYRGNAELKAEAFYMWAGVPALADDTGLEVFALQGSPGIYSARYAGEGASAASNVEKLLRELRGVRDRIARFRCVLVLKTDLPDLTVVEGSLEGSIAEAPRGGGGFGYDNVFLVGGFGKTLAELKEQHVPVRTHRIQALDRLFQALKIEKLR